MSSYKVVDTNANLSVLGFKKLYQHRYQLLDRFLRQNILRESSKAIIYDFSEVLDLSVDVSEVYVIGRIIKITQLQKGCVYQCEQLIDNHSYFFEVTCKNLEETMQITKLYVGAHVAFLTRVFASRLYIKKIIWPYMGPTTSFVYPKSIGEIAVISDVHIAADEFNETAFLKFIKDVNVRKEVSHVVVVGDVISGIGVYPSQHVAKHNTIKQQQNLFYEYFSQFRKDLEIIMIPGNHCFTTGLAEPQEFTKSFIKDMSSLNITFYTNPAFLVIKNLKFILYHGRVMDSLVRDIPEFTYNQIADVKQLLLKSRHLAPVLDNRTVAAPTLIDYLVIDQIPHIFCTGHVHTSCCEIRQGVLLVNPGSFQNLTDLQKKTGIIPSTDSAVFITCNDITKSYIKHYNDL